MSDTKLKRSTTRGTGPVARIVAGATLITVALVGIGSGAAFAAGKGTGYVPKCPHSSCD